VYNLPIAEMYCMTQQDIWFIESVHGQHSGFSLLNRLTIAANISLFLATSSCERSTSLVRSAHHVLVRIRQA
jgi:hypothetical protein